VSFVPSMRLGINALQGSHIQPLGDQGNRQCCFPSRTRCHCHLFWITFGAFKQIAIIPRGVALLLF